ncbi:MAG: hypothetical protein V1701_02850 [Planctomycetota bacterium]
MNREDIVRAYIEKSGGLHDYIISKVAITGDVLLKISCLDKPFMEYLNLYSDLLFDVDRAKKFWGEQFIYHKCTDVLHLAAPPSYLPAWKCGQREILEAIQDGEDPLSIIEEFLRKG